jgi:anti-sigma B factor antagonist
MMTMTASDRVVTRAPVARPGVVVIVHGELDLCTAPDLERALGDMISRYPDVVLDLSGLEFCDCYGLNLLLRANRRAAERGARLRLARPLAPGLARLLALTGTRSVFDCCDRVPDAHDGVYVRLDDARGTNGGPASA